jgi:hypothetical protein
MGLYVHSLGEIPNGAERAYYVYLLDYGGETGLYVPRCEAGGAEKLPM